MTRADALQRPLQQQQGRGGSNDTKGAISLAAQIRSFNQQQFKDTKTTDHTRDVEMDVDSLFHDSDDDDDEDQQQQQQQQQQRTSDEGDGNEYAAHSITGYESEDEVDEEEEAAFAMMDQLQLLQTRNVRKSAAVAAALRGGMNARSASFTHRKRSDANQHTSSVSAGMELTQAEERIAALEAQLLDAEETICHLKAEKLAAFREVEKLTVSLQKQQQRSTTDNNTDLKSKSEKKKKSESVNIWKMTPSSDEDREKPKQHEDDNGDDNNKEEDRSALGVEELRTKVRELEERLIEQQENQSLEQEEHMAVIREQELEIQKLKLDLERMNETCEDLEAQLYRAFQVTSPVSSSSPVPKCRSKSGHHVEFTSDQDEEEDNDGNVAYDDGVFMRQSLGTLKGLRSPSLDSSTSISPGSESGSSSVGPLSNGESHLVMHWREELIRHPTPHFDLDSPEVHYLLHSWTTNLQKLHYLRMWFTQVVTIRGPLAHDFPLGVELPRLLPEIRDGFLTLVVPLLRKQTQRDIQVHSRQYNDQYHTDLRIRVIPRKL